VYSLYDDSANRIPAKTPDSVASSMAGSTDVSIVNLELVLSGFRGYPQVDSGGTHLSASPQIAQELEWAGFNMLVTANNHSFDFGSERILENLRSISKTNLVQAGTGKDLPAARQQAAEGQPRQMGKRTQRVHTAQR